MNKSINSGVACLVVLLALACRFGQEQQGRSLALPTLEAGLPVQLGDANQDGVVNMSDAAAAAAHVQGQRPAGLSEAAADVNCNHVIDADDVALIAEASAGLRILSCAAAPAVEPGSSGGARPRA